MKILDFLLLTTWKPLSSDLLLDDDMRSRGEDGHGGDDGEHREEDKAQAVQHHRGELPVSLDRSWFFITFYLVSNNFYLLQYQV